MDSVTIENYRCFRERQTARLAPLTLLVGENSTGKTSFLALLRALWDVAVRDALPDFRQEPYDLGGFGDVVYSDSSQNEQPESFHAGFADSHPAMDETVSFKATFEDSDGVITPVSTRVSAGDAWVSADTHSGQNVSVRSGIGERRWKSAPVKRGYSSERDVPFSVSRAIAETLRTVSAADGTAAVREASGQYATATPDKSCEERFSELQDQLGIWRWLRVYPIGNFNVPFAGAPIRSRPKRTYDPTNPARDPEGANVPTYLARLSRREPDEWKDLKRSLEGFGQASGLFDEIHIESFGRTDDSTPFQVRFRKFGKRRKGLHRNLMDVGYGVSQALPLVTELLRPDAPSLFLLQQPEVHLHPSAQAALGSLFCSVAGPDRQIVVETHSDNIIDRVRMDVRDKKTHLTHQDVSILYFERRDADVTIHSIEFDKNGNVLGAPPGYRQFFSDELTRSIGLL